MNKFPKVFTDRNHIEFMSPTTRGRLIKVHLPKIPKREELKQIVQTHLQCEADHVQIYEVRNYIGGRHGIEVYVYHFVPSSAFPGQKPWWIASKIQPETGMTMSEQAQQLRAFTKAGLYQKICKLADEIHYESDLSISGDSYPSKITWFFADGSILIRNGYDALALPKS